MTGKTSHAGRSRYGPDSLPEDSEIRWGEQDKRVLSIFRP